MLILLTHPPTDVTRAVDLCAAPGSWSQVLSKRLYEDGKKEDVKIIAVVRRLAGYGPIARGNSDSRRHYKT